MNDLFFTELGKDSPGSNLVLAGFMGTGKSAAGQIIAARTGLAFRDLDQIIEQRAGRTIPSIFAEEGEHGFRRRERDAVKEVVGKRDLVIATGGGTLLNAANRTDLGASGLIVCLNASPETLLQRLRHDASRPLLRTPDRRDRLLRMLDERRPVYDRIPCQVDTDGLSLEEVACKVIRIWKERNFIRTPFRV